jgi:hypothetical protein
MGAVRLEAGGRIRIRLLSIEPVPVAHPLAARRNDPGEISGFFRIQGENARTPAPPAAFDDDLDGSGPRCPDAEIDVSRPQYLGAHWKPPRSLRDIC